ncbi:MAG: response regulator [Candidatus Bathyarchaeia archaeon]|jgi:DNA-binding response OmpR family regulator
MAETTFWPMVELRLTGTEDFLRVLYVDDDVCLLKVSKQILEMDGKFKVDITTSVEEAFEMLKNQSYAAVISDYEMPRKNGLQFLAELRDRGNDIPFVIFTGRGREEVAIRASNLGADGYFSKTGDPETVYGELIYGILQSVEKRDAKA